ncbi:hypothetical protein V8D89_001230 [Ganoderma adspersum]
MSATHVSAEELESVYRTIYCVYAACVILIYDWILCLDDEVRFVWKSDSGVTGTSLVYLLSRYMLLIQTFLAVVTAYPMSDLLSNIGMDADRHWDTFSALRAYALSNRSMILAVLIVLLALPPTVIRIRVEYTVPNALYQDAAPCSVTLVTRASQLAAELLVIIITWWYTYQSYRLRKHGIKGAKTISSLLVYNGTIYFLFLATLYVLDIIFNTATVPDKVLDADSLLDLFYDPITSILVCHFILSLRRFDTSAAATTYNEARLQSREHTHSRSVLQFAAQPSDTLPSFIASFAQPVHTESLWSETDSETTVNGNRSVKSRDIELGAVAGET